MYQKSDGIQLVKSIVTDSGKVLTPEMHGWIDTIFGNGEYLIKIDTEDPYISDYEYQCGSGIETLRCRHHDFRLVESREWWR